MLKKILLCTLLISTSAYADGGFGGSFAGGLTGSMVGGLVTGAATHGGGRSSDSRKSKENYRAIKDLRDNVAKDLKAMARRMDAMEEHFEKKIEDLHEEIKDLKRR